MKKKKIYILCDLEDYCKKMVNVRANISSWGIVLISVALMGLFAFSVFGAQTVKTSAGLATLTINEDTSTLLNFSVNNTDVGVDANISQVSVVLPSGVLLTSNTNGTEVVAQTFTNTSTSLTWQGNDMIMNNTFKYFWFNLSVATPGSYSIKINSTNATGPMMENTVTLTVNDITVPSTNNFASPTPAAGSNLSQTSLPINISAADNVAVDRIRIYVYNSTGLYNNTNVSTTDSAFINLTGLAEGFYYINSTVNDTSNNLNSSSGTRTILLDTTRPAVIALIPVNNSAYNNSQAIQLAANVTDFSSNVSSVIANITLPNSTIDQVTLTRVSGNKFNNSYTIPHLRGTYNVTFVATDFAGNVNSSERTNFTVTDITSPIITVNFPAWGVRYSTSTVTINITTDEESQCYYIVDSGTTNVSLTNDSIGRIFFGTTSELSNGGHSIDFYCNDTSGNLNTSETEFQIDADVGSNSTGGNGGGSPTVVVWKNTYVETENELSSVGIIKEMTVKERVLVKVAGEEHSVGVTGLTGGLVTVSVMSTPQQATIAIGQESKFDLNSDGYYDLKVKLDSINTVTNKASLSITSTYEKVVTADGTQTTATNENNTGLGTGSGDVENNGDAWIWIIVIVVVLIVIGFAIYWNVKGKKHYR